MKLLSINIKNFKGIKDIDHKFNGDNWSVTAQNKSGKTSIYDAFLWLLFGKDSDGRSDFNARPLDKHNIVQEKLTITVSAMIEHYGDTFTLTKENKKGTNGFNNKFWIDSVPKKAGEFMFFVNGICEESTFKMLTDLQYFNKMHWQDRRNVLLELAGKDIAKPIGFESLIENMANLDIDEYRKVIMDRRKLQQAKLDQINPRIDELQKSIDDVGVTGGLIDLEDEREQIEGEIASLEGELELIREKQAELVKAKSIINQHELERTKLEATIKSDRSHLSVYTDEIAEIKKIQSEKETELLTQKELIKRKDIEIKTIDLNLATYQRNLEKIRAEFQKTKQVEIDTNCPTCEQELPLKKLQEVKEKHQSELESISKHGTKLKGQIANLQEQKESAESELYNLKSQLEELEVNFESCKTVSVARLAELQKIIDNQETPDFTKDIQWQALTETIEKLTSELPTIDNERIAEIDKERRELQELLNKANKAFAQKDTIERNRERINELEQEGKDIAQTISNYDGELEQIKEYKQAESDLIVAAVNGQFKHVEFKLFETQINCDIRPCCTALNNGVPYPDMSTGQKIQCGIDIVQRLSEHYGKSMPLFIDNAESITLDIEHSGQTIKLIADKTVKQLTFVKD